MKAISEQDARYLEELAAELPPIIARKQVDWFLGGLIAPQTLAKEDSAGTGPQEAIRFGTVGVAYRTKALLEWVAGKWGMERIMSIRNLPTQRRPGLPRKPGAANY